MGDSSLCKYTKAGERATTGGPPQCWDDTGLFCKDHEPRARPWVRILCKSARTVKQLILLRNSQCSDRLGEWEESPLAQRKFRGKFGGCSPFSKCMQPCPRELSLVSRFMRILNHKYLCWVSLHEQMPHSEHRGRSLEGWMRVKYHLPQGGSRPNARSQRDCFSPWAHHHWCYGVSLSSILVLQALMLLSTGSFWVHGNCSDLEPGESYTHKQLQFSVYVWVSNLTSRFILFSEKGMMIFGCEVQMR